MGEPKKEEINMKLQNLTHILIGIACIGLLPRAQAISPAPDGGYPGGNTAEGQNALFSLTTGGYNTGVGFLSLRSNATASFNTAIGAGTLLGNTADGNTAAGGGALFSNTTGPSNTATGAFALFSNTTNGGNTANGYQALFYNTGFGNTADGYQALYNNTTGYENAANGGQALFSNTTGFANTASGIQALFQNTTGFANTAIGLHALSSNNIGSGNTASGEDALSSNTTGEQNTAYGTIALESNTTGSYNTAIGEDALSANTTGNRNIALGFSAGGGVTTADNVICIGANVVGNDVSNTCFIGNIFGVITINANAIPAVIDSAGQLGTVSSSRRFKKEIKPMNKSSEVILGLKPVTFHYKSDATGTPQFGLIAEEVAAVNPDLVVRDKKGEIYTVRYEAVNAMLLNEFLKEHNAFVTEQHRVKKLQASVAQQRKQIEALTAGLQKVSTQLAAASPSRGGLEASKFATGRIRGGGPAPQVVNNP